MIPENKMILYATDITKNSVYAFFYVADMARRYNARIVILHSIERTRHLAAHGTRHSPRVSRDKDVNGMGN